MFSISQISVKLVITIAFIFPLILAILRIIKSKMGIFRIPYFGKTIRFVIIAAICLIYLFIDINLWTQYIDLNRLFSPRQYIQREVEKKSSWLPVRERDALYQDGNIVARVTGVNIDLLNRKIYFEVIYKSNTLNLHNNFKYLEYHLEFGKAESIIKMDANRAQDGQIIEKAVCEIVNDN